MMMNTRPRAHFDESGLALAEALVSVALIGIFSLIAISSLSPVLDSADTVKDKRNAQTLAHAASALAAEGDQTLEQLSTEGDVLAYLASLGRDGGGNGAVRVPAFSEGDLQAAAEHLEYAHGNLRYVPDPARRE